MRLTLCLTYARDSWLCRDLADMNNDGRLTRDGFAVAMHLIQGKLAGKELPATELQPADDLVILAAQAFVNLWRITSKLAFIQKVRS